MRIPAFFAFLLAAVLLPLAAGAAPKSGGSGVAVFCEGTYALCIKAPCQPVTNADGTVTKVLCSCVVEQGVSMGPGSCSSRKPRKPRKHGSTTHLVSTYSNKFNKEEQNLTCDNPDQKWANCYGAACVTDPADPTRAQCNCPVRKGKMVTLGGKCAQDSCNAMWSAARPAENAYANNHFYNTVKGKFPNAPVNPPAKVCGAI